MLAAAVLEREGFEVVPEGASAFRVSVAADSARWEVVAGDRCHTGDNFASLAEFLRKENHEDA